MTILSRFSLVLSLTCLSLGHAIADDYYIAVGTPLLGTSIPPGKVGLGIPVSVDKSWAQLNDAEKLAWRTYTELLDAEVVPPFPVPNLRGFLRKLDFDTRFDLVPQVERRTDIMLVVRVSETGEVTTVDIMHGSDKASKALSDADNVLAYRYIKALMATRFSPALLKGQPVASAFPMPVSHLTLTR